MPINPAAVWMPIRANGTQSSITARALVIHAPVDAEGATGRSMYDWYNSQGNETHFYIDKNGVLFQYLDTNIRGDAQYSANAFALSVEVHDGRGSHPDWRATPPMTDVQMATLHDLAIWCHVVEGIPLTLVGSVTGSGIGYHQEFSAWNRKAHDCPGAQRVAQIKYDLIPSLTTTVTPASPKEQPSMWTTWPDNHDEEFGVYLGAVTHRWTTAVNPGTFSPWTVISAARWYTHITGTAMGPRGAKVWAAHSDGEDVFWFDGANWAGPQGV